MVKALRRVVSARIRRQELTEPRGWALQGRGGAGRGDWAGAGPQGSGWHPAVQVHLGRICVGTCSHMPDCSDCLMAVLNT